jgi:glycerol-3-phosphate dehydrogenase
MEKSALQKAVLANAPPWLIGQFLVPVYSWARAGHLIGMKMYDAVAGKNNLFPSSFLSREATLKRMPGLKQDGLRGAVCYSDGQFDDARYDLALLETFDEAGGMALNYARVTNFVHDPRGRLSSAEVRDTISGEEFSVKANKYVNATGTGADKIRRMANPALASRMRPEGVPRISAETFSSDAFLAPHTDGRVIFGKAGAATVGRLTTR